MVKKFSKSESREYIEKFFSNLSDKTPRDIKKALSIAMSHNIKLGRKKHLFCKKCHSIYTPRNTQIRIKNGFKVIRCLNCNNLSRRKLK